MSTDDSIRFQGKNEADGATVTITLSLAEACRIRLFEFLHNAGYEVLRHAAAASKGTNDDG